MSSEKPFWEGKTCKEMAGLHIKVTFKNGDVATGVADKNGDIKSAYVLTLGMGDDLFVPEADIESIELVDDPEYERIDSIEDVRVGDIFVANDGNRYPVMNVDLDSMDADGAGYAVRVNGSVPGSFWIRNSMLAYALRPKPQLPDHEGLWLDKDDALWLVVAFVKPGMTDTLLETQLIGDEYGFSPASESIAIDSPMVSLHAPFRPAKAVEA